MSAPAQIMTVGLEFAVQESLSEILLKNSHIDFSYDLEKLMNVLDPAPHVVLCGFPPAEVSTIEVAQILRMNYPDVPIYFVTIQRVGYDRKIFMKNGFTDAFLFPLEGPLLERRISDDLAERGSRNLVSYRSVKLIDLTVDTQLDFDLSIYLPMNRKYIPYASAGDPLSEERLERLNQHKMASIYVRSDQMKLFYAYTARSLQKVGASKGLSATERREKLVSSVRAVMSGIFHDSSKEGTFEQGRAIASQCKEIVHSYMLATPAGEWYRKLFECIGEGREGHSHSANVSTYASLFAIGLGVDKPEHLALAGLLHDVGLVDIPPEIVSVSARDRTPEQEEHYRRHPELSIEIIKSRKIIVPEIVLKAILQHHERCDGTGYPQNLTGEQICIEAQILSIADYFDELTSVADGSPRLSPLEALRHLRSEAESNSGFLAAPVNLIDEVLKLFPLEESKECKKAVA